MVPVAALPPMRPFTDHVTEALAAFCTVAVNTCVAPTATVAAAGVTVTDTPDCRACPEFASIISDDSSIASYAEPGILRIVDRLSLFHRSSGAPEIYQDRTSVV